jgi:hypothetical protein
VCIKINEMTGIWKPVYDDVSTPLGLVETSLSLLSDAPPSWRDKPSPSFPPPCLHLLVEMLLELLELGPKVAAAAPAPQVAT